VYAGHVGVAIGAHGLRRTIPLWFLVVASQLPDWADAAACLAGLRTTVPGMLTHSIPAVAVLGVAFAIAWYAVSRDVFGMLVVLAVVLTHVLGDYFTGIKPTWPGGPLIGLQLYRQPVLDFALEASVVLIGWLFYRKSFPPEKRSSRDVILMLVVLVLIQLAADIVFLATPGLKKC
jgi:hypothetical protein